MEERVLTEAEKKELAKKETLCAISTDCVSLHQKMVALGKISDAKGQADVKAYQGMAQVLVNRVKAELEPPKADHYQKYKAADKELQKELKPLETIKTSLKTMLVAYDNQLEAARQKVIADAEAERKAEEKAVEDKRVAEAKRLNDLEAEAREKGDAERAAKIAARAKQVAEEPAIPTPKPPVYVPEPPKTKGFYISSTAIVEDESQIPREYLMVNSVKLNAAARMPAVERQAIPGVRFQDVKKAR